MKQTVITLLTLFVGITFLGCEEDNPTNGNSASQTVLVFADHYYTFWNDWTNEFREEPTTLTRGNVYADPIPQFIHLKLGDVVFNSDYHVTSRGSIYFDYNRLAEESVRIDSNFTPLNVEVKTSFGQVNGTILLPDTITTLTLSEYDTLQLGESFTISWEGSSADFYDVVCTYEWGDEVSNYHYEFLSRVVTENSITFSDSIFTHNGEIEYIYVRPLNGPFPEAGAVGNMSGSGRGFIYYMTEDTEYSGSIIVGSGLADMIVGSSIERNERVVHERIRERIENIILGN